MRGPRGGEVEVDMQAGEYETTMADFCKDYYRISTANPGPTPATMCH